MITCSRHLVFKNTVSLILTLVLLVSASPAAIAHVRQAQAAPKQSHSISASEFARMVREFSEDGGSFISENFISNETSYLHIVDSLNQLGTSGGAYIGVGPEQNFTYIAKTRPQIAFVIDIRRQAIIQHLMFKALFHLADNANRFLYLLLSRPAIGKDVPGPAASIDEALAYLKKTPADIRAFESNLAEIKKLIQQAFQFPLLPQDIPSLVHVYESFRDDGLAISFRLNGGGAGLFGFFPSLEELIVARDLNGKRGNFLASPSDYDFVRQMHERNLIIPVVGDFAGKRALTLIGNYLQKNGYTVNSFYASNVEQYLFDGGSFRAFAENVRKLPTGEKSLFIRTIFEFVGPHPARVQGHNVTTLLQYIPVFLKDFDAGLYTDYWKLVTTHFIAANRSKG